MHTKRDTSICGGFSPRSLSLHPTSVAFLANALKESGFDYNVPFVIETEARYAKFRNGLRYLCESYYRYVGSYRIHKVPLHNISQTMLQHFK
jgi:hypothetical protein